MNSQLTHREFSERSRLWMIKVSYAGILIFNIYDTQTRHEYSIRSFRLSDLAFHLCIDYNNDNKDILINLNAFRIKLPVVLLQRSPYKLGFFFKSPFIATYFQEILFVRIIFAYRSI